MSRRQAGGQAPIVDLTLKGCAAEARFLPAVKGAGPGDKIPWTVTVLSWSALLVGCSRRMLRLFFFVGTLSQRRCQDVQRGVYGAYDAIYG
jgi:hypothetical protein